VSPKRSAQRHARNSSYMMSISDNVVKTVELLSV